MTRIILTRHGHVEGIDPPRYRGRDDLPLTERGRRQAERLGKALSRRGGIDRIFTSPLSRCVDTGRIVADQLARDSTILPGLTDLDYGDWTGRLHADVKAGEPERYALWWTAPHLMRPPGGESLQELCARIADVIREVIGRSETVLLVGHNSSNRAALLTLMDLPLSAYWRLEQSPCSITEIDVRLPDVTVHCINETGHLTEA